MSRAIKKMPPMVKRKVGRPLLYETPEEILAKFEDYKKHVEYVRKPMTLSGMRLYLGFNSRQSLLNYQERSAEFFDAIKKVYLEIAEHYEIMGQSGKGGNFPIFALKQMGWTDRREIRHENMSKSIGVVKIMLEDNRKEVKAEIEDGLQNKR